MSRPRARTGIYRTLSGFRFFASNTGVPNPTFFGVLSLIARVRGRRVIFLVCCIPLELKAKKATRQVGVEDLGRVRLAEHVGVAREERAERRARLARVERAPRPRRELHHQ